MREVVGTGAYSYRGRLFAEGAYVRRVRGVMTRDQLSGAFSAQLKHAVTWHRHINLRVMINNL